MGAAGSLPRQGGVDLRHGWVPGAWDPAGPANLLAVELQKTVARKKACF